jgi:hypothetical protein
MTVIIELYAYWYHVCLIQESGCHQRRKMIRMSDLL